MHRVQYGNVQVMNVAYTVMKEYGVLLNGALKGMWDGMLLNKRSLGNTRHILHNIMYEAPIRYVCLCDLLVSLVILDFYVKMQIICDQIKKLEASRTTVKDVAGGMNIYIYMCVYAWVMTYTRFASLLAVCAELVPIAGALIGATKLSSVWQAETKVDDVS
jgi:hypothetical protein